MRAGWCCTKAGCTSTTEHAMATKTRDDDRLTAPPRMRAVPSPRFETPLVPRNSISGRALDRGRRHHDVPGLAHHRRGHAGRRRGERMAVGRGARGHHPGACRRPAAISTPTSTRRLRVARAFPGIGDVRPISKEESAKLLEPWLGSGLTLDELPVPRLIVVKIAPGAAPDIPQLAPHAGRAGAGRHRSTTIAAGSTACAPWPAARWRPASACSS